MNTDKVTRVEIIDHTPCTYCQPTTKILCGACGGTGMKGRSVIFWNANKQVDLQLQDDDRTLKIFVHERYEDSTN